jgi:hypothetical protein
MNTGKERQAERLLQEAAKSKNSARLVLAAYRNEKKRLNAEIITESEFAEFEKKIIARINNLPDDALDRKPEMRNVDLASVFLSYCDNDLHIAEKIRNEMGKHRIRVVMDRYDLMTGQHIAEFTAKQTRNSDGVVMVVSRDSLRSVSTSYESMLAIYNEFLNNIKCYPVVLDNSYKNEEFCSEVFNGLEIYIEAKRNAIRQHNGDPKHLQLGLTGLIDAHNQLPRLLKLLREVQVSTYSEAGFEIEMKKLAIVIIEAKNNRLNR